MPAVTQLDREDNMVQKKHEIPSSHFHDLKPTIWIGKSGITETIIEEIRGQTKSRGVVKLKWLASAEVDPGQVAEKSGTDLLMVRGRTMVLADPQFSRRSKPRNI